MTDAAARGGRLMSEPAPGARTSTSIMSGATTPKRHGTPRRKSDCSSCSGSTPGSTVLDLGAGTGQFTLAVAPRCARVIAADVSQPMLERLRSKVAEAGFDNVETVEAGFVSYEHKGAPVDVAYSRYALHHVPDFWKARALVRLARCMRPGGLLRVWDIVYSFAPEEADGRIEQWCASIPETGEETDWVRADVEEHVRDEHSTFTWLLEPLLERSGFDIQATDYTDDGIFAKYLARRR